MSKAEWVIGGLVGLYLLGRPKRAAGAMVAPGGHPVPPAPPLTPEQQFESALVRLGVGAATTLGITGAEAGLSAVFKSLKEAPAPEVFTGSEPPPGSISPPPPMTSGADATTLSTIQAGSPLTENQASVLGEPYQGSALESTITAGQRAAGVVSPSDTALLNAAADIEARVNESTTSDEALVKAAEVVNDSVRTESLTYAQGALLAGILASLNAALGGPQQVTDTLGALAAGGGLVAVSQSFDAALSVASVGAAVAAGILAPLAMTGGLSILISRIFGLGGGSYYTSFPQAVARTNNLIRYSMYRLTQSLAHATTKQDVAQAIANWKASIATNVGGFGDNTGPFDLPVPPGATGTRHEGGLVADWAAITSQIRRLVNAMVLTLPGHLPTTAPIGIADLGPPATLTAPIHTGPFFPGETLQWLPPTSGPQPVSRAVDQLGNVFNFEPIGYVGAWFYGGPDPGPVSTQAEMLARLYPVPASAVAVAPGLLPGMAAFSYTPPPYSPPPPPPPVLSLAAGVQSTTAIPSAVALSTDPLMSPPGFFPGESLRWVKTNVALDQLGNVFTYSAGRWLYAGHQNGYNYPGPATTVAEAVSRQQQWSPFFAPQGLVFNGSTNVAFPMW